MHEKMPKRVPFWKLRREVVRLLDQLIRLPQTIAALPRRLREPAKRRTHDRDFDNLTRLSDGDIALTPRIAVLLIYQPNGLAASTVLTCNWLASEGYSPFIVSNSPLRVDDLARLRAVSWRILERENFGYDFGGYRDALRCIERWQLAAERMIVMNDSVWLPMVPGLMRRLEALAETADIVGLLQDEKVQHDTNGGQPTVRFHLESYFYLFTKTALEAPAFRAFWHSYQMTDSKPFTIKYGEIGFSRQMNAAGLRLDALTRRSLFLAELANKDDAFLIKTLRYAAYADADLAKAAERLTQRDPTEAGWREAALDHMRRAVNRKRFNTTLPYANDKIFGTIFMKKSRETIFCNMRESYLRAVADLEVVPPQKQILFEIEGVTNKPLGQISNAETKDN